MTNTTCQHKKYKVIDIYDRFYDEEKVIVVIEPEEKIGPDLMKLAKIIKIRCLDCKVVTLAKVFRIRDVCSQV